MDGATVPELELHLRRSRSGIRKQLEVLVATKDVGEAFIYEQRGAPPQPTGVYRYYWARD